MCNLGGGGGLHILHCIQYMTHVIAMTQSETVALSLKDILSSTQVNKTVS